MKMFRDILVGALAFLLASVVSAQGPGTVANHAFAIGKGPGVSGYTSLLCAASQIAIGSATDPVCRTISGDGSISAAGIFTLSNVNANVGSFGSATRCPTLTANAKGLITALSDATCTPAVTSITGLGANVATALATPLNVNGGLVAPTPTRAGDILYFNGTNFVTLAGNNSGTNCLVENGSGVPSFSSCASGSGTVTGITAGAGLVSSTTAACSQTAITVSGTLSKAECVNAQSATSVTIQDSDRAKLITANNAAAQTYNIAQAGAASNFQAGWYVDITNVSTSLAGVVTVTPSTSTINGATNLTVLPGKSARVVSDGSNYQVAQSTFRAPVICDIILTSAATCNNGGSSANNGTYTTPAGALYVRVRMVGGGASTSGSGSAGIGAGSNGNNSTFNTTTTAPGGSTNSTQNGGAGGVAGANCDVTVPGGAGQNADGTIANPPGAAGGGTFFGPGGGPGTPATQNGSAGPTNSGAGGGGAGAGTGVGAVGGGGGGAYCEKTFPAGTYSYSVGAAVAGGTAGTSGGAGGGGAAGHIIVEAMFQ